MQIKKKIFTEANIKNHSLLLGVVFVILFFAVGNVLAAPTITGVGGGLTNGESVTVLGSGFGVKNPVAPYLYDTVDNIPSYDGLPDGTIVPVGGSNPWSASNGSSPSVTINKSGPLRPNRTASYKSIGQQSTLGYPTASHVDSAHFYVSWWAYPDTVMPIVGYSVKGDYSSVNNYAYKDAALYNGYYYISLQDNNQGHTPNAEGSLWVWWQPQNVSNKILRMNSYTSFTGGYEFSWTTNLGTYIYNSIGDSSNWHYISQGYPRWPVENYTWNRQEVVVDSSGSAPFFDAIVNGTTRAHVVASEAMSQNLDYVDGIGWDPNTYWPGALFWGEVYIDTTFARIEICSGSTWTSRGHCEIQVPHTVWNDEQLQININQGAFADSSNQYLYVIDSNGDANTAGYPITFGSGSSDTTPPSSPSGLAVS